MWADRGGGHHRAGCSVWDPIKPVDTVFQMPTAVSTQFLATLSAILLGVGLGVGAIGLDQRALHNLPTAT